MTATPANPLQIEPVAKGVSIERKILETNDDMVTTREVSGDVLKQ